MSWYSLFNNPPPTKSFSFLMTEFSSLKSINQNSLLSSLYNCDRRLLWCSENERDAHPSYYSDQSIVIAWLFRWLQAFVECFLRIGMFIKNQCVLEFNGWLTTSNLLLERRTIGSSYCKKLTVTCSLELTGIWVYFGIFQHNYFKSSSPAC